MMALAPFFFWRLFFLLLAMNFAVTTGDILAGDFDDIGLPAPMITMEAVGNGVEAAGWLLVFLLSFTSKQTLAARIAVFLAGLLFFDVITTFVLPMPLPPYFLVWGTALAGIELLAARHLIKEAPHA